MFKKISILILLLLLFLSISVVSANEDVNTTISDNGGENTILSQNNDDLLSNQITVNEVNYNDYFGSDGKASSNINLEILLNWMVHFLIVILFLIKK